MSDLSSDSPSVQSHPTTTETLADDPLNLSKMARHSDDHAVNADIRRSDDVHEGTYLSIAVDEGSIETTSDAAQTPNQNEGKTFVDSPAEYEYFPVLLSHHKAAEISDQRVTSVTDSFQSANTVCNERNEDLQLKTEFKTENVTHDLDASSEASKLTVIVNAMKKQPDTSSREMPPCSSVQEKTDASGETTCSSSTTCVFQHSSTVIYSSFQSENTETTSPTTENSSECEILLQSLSPSETDPEIFLEPNKNLPNASFPKVNICEQNFNFSEEIKNISKLEANVQTPTPAERHQWAVMSHKYIQKEGYRLGIRPGIFYSSCEGYFVEVPNGINYEIILTNENPVPCNVDVYIDSSPSPVICFRLNPGRPMKFDGPTFCENKFVFVRSKDAPPQSGINPGDTKNGLIHAIFTPQKVETLRSRTASEPVPFSRSLSYALEMLGIEDKPRKMRSYTASNAGAERGIDLSLFCQGATALRGEQTQKQLRKADPMEVDTKRQVHIRLRLIARIDDPSLPSDEDICSLYPPSVEELLKN